MYVYISVGILVLFGFIYLWRLNRAMLGIPEEVQKISPHRWTPDEIKAAYAKILKDPIDDTVQLPPKLERRYVVVGGSGLVGGCIILHLLARGQSPESIRLVDFRPPVRADLLDDEKASKVQFVQADITSETSTNDAFNKPWPSSVAKFALTVIHTAAVINPSERAECLLYRCSAVNTNGTINVLNAAKASGADVFIATSSGSVDMLRVGFWIAPWTKWPRRFVQIVGKVDTTAPLRSHKEYFGNYAVSKAAAEKAVIEANRPTFKTGCIRPANGIYGNRYDHTLGTYMNLSKVPTWIAHIIQNFVHSKNVSIAHLQLEAALLAPSPKCAAKTFIITDPNPPISFGDIYTLIPTISSSPFELQIIPALPLFLLSYLIEAYTILQYLLPSPIGKLMPVLPPDIAQLQPTLFSISTCHVVADDGEARKSVSEGGIGYRGICTTLEGMCMQVQEWNMRLNDEGKKGVGGEMDGEMGNIGGVGAAMKA